MKENLFIDEIGCTKHWIDLGIIDDQAIQRIKSGEIVIDRGHPEHTRYRFLCKFLDRQENLSDKQVELLLDIALNELQCHRKDSLGASVYHDLLKVPYLTESQFNKVAASVADENFDKIVSRFRFIRALSKKDFKRSVVEDALLEGDSYVHKFLLDNDFLDVSQLEWISKNGGNRALRNLARLKNKLR